MTGPSMTLADRLQEAVDREAYSSMSLPATLMLGTWLVEHSAEIVAALRDRDRLREALRPVFEDHSREDGSRGEPDWCEYDGDNWPCPFVTKFGPFFASQPSPSSEEAPAPVSAVTTTVEVAGGGTLEILPEGTRIRLRKHPELTGVIKHYEWSKPGLLSPIPYCVGWDDSQRACELLGWFFVYPSPASIEPESRP